MSSVVISGNTSGAVTLTVPDVAGTNTATLPAATGTVMVSGNMPAFSAYQSSAQTLSSFTYTKLQFQTEEFDTNSNFDNSTNYRFTPTVAGYYQVSGCMTNSASATPSVLIVYKNGSAFKRLQSTGSASISAISGSCLIYFNGSTDYVELYGYVDSGQALQASAATTYFQASMVRAA